MWHKVREFWNNRKLKFEGQYLNGEKNGNCKEFDEKGRLEFK